MNGFSFGQYYPADSFLHRLDPRAKIICALFFIVCTFLCNSALSFALLIFAVLCMIFVSKIPLSLVLRSVRPLIWIISFTAVINIFMFRGEHRLTPEGWWIAIYAEGVRNAIFMVLRITALIIGTGLFLTYTTTPIALTDGLEQLLSPLKRIKVPVHDFAMMMTIAMRFIPTLTEETQKIMNAQKARGADFTTGSLVKRAKALIPILIPLFISAFNRAFELATAMECRCYHGGEGRTRLNVLHFHKRDLYSVLLLIAVGVALFFLNRIKIGVIF